MRSEVRNLPADFLNRLRRIVPSQKFDAVANTFAEQKPTTFRINTLKTSAQDIKESLSSKGFQLISVNWFPDAFIIRKGRLKDLETTEEYKSGAIYVQNLSSMIPPIILDPKKGDSVLDLTAAPGGKTTQMASMIQNEGKIVAVENNEIRYSRLKANIATQGAECVEAILGFGESYGSKCPEFFDKVLLDAPCSAEGRFLCTAPGSYSYWDIKKIEQNAKLQKKLIGSALKALKPSGMLIYSTCTFAPEENEAVIHSAIEMFPGSLEIQPVSLKLNNQMIGLVKWGNQNFDSNVKKCLRVLPSPDMEGFFVAKIRKRRHSEAEGRRI